MILDIPYAYDVSGTKHGNTISRDYRMWETLPLEIREVSPFDAPLAVSWDDRFPEGILIDDYARREWGPHGNDGFAHTVFFEDSHWKALDAHAAVFRPDDAEYPPYTIGDLAGCIAANEENALIRSLGFDSRARRMIEETGNDGLSAFTKVRVSERHTMRALLKSIVDGLISVDGRLYRRCDEPRLWLSRGFTQQDRTTAGDRSRIAVLRVDTNHARELPGQHIMPGGRLRFSLAELDEVIGHATEHNERCGTPMAAAMNARNMAGAPTVHLEYSIDREKHVQEVALRSARDFLGLAKQHTLAALPPQTIYLLLDMEGHMASLADPVSMSAFEDTVARLREEISYTHHPLWRYAGHLYTIAGLLDSREVNLIPAAPGRNPS